MHLFAFEGKAPVVHPGAFVAPTATLIGDVTVEDGASIWYGVVIRADICTVVVRAGTNVQDNSVLHAAPGETLTIGPDATIGHGCVVHCSDVGEKALIGNGSTLLDGATVGPGTLVAAGSVVIPGAVIPGGVVAAGIPCKPTKPIAGTSSEPWVATNSVYYRELGARHAAGTTRLEPPEPPRLAP